MSVYRQILEWSKDRPNWQRDALRRLLYKQTLDATDIAELADICEAEFGVRYDDLPGEPLAVGDLPEAMSLHGETRVFALRDLENVNVLRDDLEFAPRGVTLVYGPNGSGKSGHARLLKLFCRARGDEPEILPNQLDENARKEVPRASLVYGVGGGEYTFDWRPGEEPHDALAQISVFDSTAADIYVAKKSPAAYRPSGLDLLPRLAEICDQVKEELSRRQQAVTENAPPLPTVPANTTAAEFLAGITAETPVVEIEAACTVQSNTAQRMREVVAELEQLEAPERKQQAVALGEKAQRLIMVAQKLDELAGEVSDEVAGKLREAKETAKTFGSAARASAKSRFAEHPVQPVGTRLWKALLDSAMAYFEQEAGGGREFPGDEYCVLCQQPLNYEAKARLEDFRQFVELQAQGKSERADRELAEMKKKLESVDTELEIFSLVQKELEASNSELSASIGRFTGSVAMRRDAMTLALETDEWALPGLADSPAGKLRELANELTTQAETMVQPPDAEKLEALRNELQQLKASETLTASIDAIKAHHKALLKVEKYDQCLKSAGTRAVSRQNGKLLKEAVTTTMSKAFDREFARLHPTNFKVSLGKGGTRKGEVLHNLTIDEAAPKTSPVDIASSGESRLLALASFFAELSTAPTTSAVVFDDPAASLDDENASALARRLAEEGNDRQVIIFSHDRRFCDGVESCCADAGVALRSIRLERDPSRAGVVATS